MSNVVHLSAVYSICAVIQPDSGEAEKAQARLSFISFLPPAVVVVSRVRLANWSTADKDLVVAQRLRRERGLDRVGQMII